MKKLLFAAALVCAALPAGAADDLQAGWAAWFNTSKLSEQWSLVSDLQLRSTDDWERIRTVNARAGLTYAWRPGITLGGGAAYIRTLNVGTPDVAERRAWQQIVFSNSLEQGTLSQRLRLEQRFIERVNASEFYSTRLRYSVRYSLPIGAAPTPNYLSLQNEVMLHLSGQEDLNGRLFDQNRAYLGIGRRISPKCDIELGYLNQYVVGRNRNTANHIVQTTLQTRW